MTDTDNDKDAAPHAEPTEYEGERIAKAMARAGLASRRDAETWIREGRVAVNGEVVTSPALNIGPRDKVTVDGAPMPLRERTRLWLYHKPRGLVTTAKDPEGRTTVFDVLPPELPRVVSVGRLDLNTEGLLLLTNDGGLARVLSHPETGWLRRYRVRAFGEVNPASLHALAKGIEIEGFSYGPIEATLDRQQGDNAWLTLGLREGKNREVRRVLEHLGLSVNRLIRLSFGPFQLGDLGEGAAEEIRTRYLKDQLGGLAEEANCDFEAPIFDRDPEPVKKVLRQREENPDAKRVRGGMTTDRKGRRVVIERIEKEKPAEDKPRRGRDDRATARPGGERGAGRGGERTFRGRDGEDGRPPRRESRGEGGFRAREDRPGRPQGDRPAREGERDGRRGPPRDRDQRPPRREGEGGRGFKPREDRPREDRTRDDRPRGDKPDRKFGDRPSGGRSFGDRPPRGDRPFGDERRGPPRDRDSRPPRRDGEGGRPFKPRGDKEERPERKQEPRPDGNRARVFRVRPDRPDRPPREARGEREERRDSRPPRRDSDSRPPRREGDARPPRRDGETRPPRHDGGKPRGSGGKPGGFGGRPGGGRPGAGGRPGGKPGGGRPGGKSGGARPGGKPRGGR